MENAVSETFPHVSPSLRGRATGSPVARPGGLNYSRRRSFKRSRFVSLIATVWIFTILMIWSRCTAARNKEQAAGVTRRRLSYSGEGFDEENFILEGCLALEDELGILRPERDSSSEGDRSRRIAELVSMFSEAASTHESMHRIQQTWGGATASPTFPIQNPAHPLEQYPESQGFVVPYHSDQAYWQGVSVYAPAEGVGPGDALSSLDPNAWIGETVGVGPTYLQGEWWQGQPSWAPSGVSGGDESQTATVANRELPDMSGVLQGGEETNQHPYVRIPVLQRGVFPRDIRSSVIFAQPLKYTMVHLPLLQLRTLFSKQTLNQEDVDALVSATESLARAAWVEARTGVRLLNPTFASEYLGRYFLAFDSLVCVIRILGHHMQRLPWWGDFVAAFDTSYSFEEADAGKQRKPKLVVQLANRLLAALNIYKTGCRPALEEVIALKRLLFSTTYSPKEFKEPLWDPWREDDEFHMLHGYLSG